MIKQLSWLDMPELKPKNKKLFSMTRKQQLYYVKKGRPIENWDRWNRWQFRLREMYMPTRNHYIRQYYEMLRSNKPKA